MSTMMYGRALAAAATLTLACSAAAFADGGDRPATTLFTQYQAQQVRPMQQQPDASARVTGTTAVFSARSHNAGVSLFEPNATAGGIQ